MERALFILGIGIAALIGALLTLAVQGFPETSIGWIDRHQGLAAWVQGIGTVCAVGVAAWVGVLPMTHERQRRAISRQEFVDAVTQAIEAMETWTHMVKWAISKRDMTVLLRNTVLIEDSEGLRAFDKLIAEPITRWPSPKAYVLAEQLRGGWQGLGRIKPSDGDVIYPNMAVEFWEQAARHEQLVALAETLLRREMAEALRQSR